MTTWRLKLTDPTLSLNELKKIHRMAVSREVERWGWLVKSSMSYLPKNIPDATGKRRIHILRVGKRLLDRDNLYGGCKPLLDAIRYLRLLVDDRPEYLDLTVTQRKTAKGEPPHTYIEIEDCEESK